MIDSLMMFPVGSLIDAFWASNFAGQIIVVVLFVGSIFAWSIMIAKWKELRESRDTSQRFLRAYRKESSPVALFVKEQRFERSALFVIYDGACNALGSALESAGRRADDLFRVEAGTANLRLSETQVNSVRNVAESLLTEQSLNMETNMNWLAIAVSAAPLLGLLGTVWGMLESFGVMATAGSSMLSAVAPGISGALLTTVVGLLVALPSAIGYNLLTEQIRRMSVTAENFVEEMLTDVANLYQEK